MTPTLTPTATLIAAHPARTPGWYETRRHGIGSSDVAAILGRNPHRSAQDVYLDKLGVPEPGSGNLEAIYFGQLLEPVVADEFARRASEYGREIRVLEVEGTLAHVDRPWQRANLDRPSSPACCSRRSPRAGSGSPAAGTRSNGTAFLAVRRGDLTRSGALLGTVTRRPASQLLRQDSSPRGETDGNDRRRESGARPTGG